MERWRDAGGQATSEYVALVGLVAIVLTLAAGLTSGGVGGQVLAGVRRGLCLVADTACVSRPPPEADLAPCPLERTTSGESLAGAFELLELGGGGTLTAVRGSDRRVTVTLADGTAAGAELGLGFSLGLGRRHGASAAVGVAASFSSGRSWTLPSAAAARAFVERYGSKATVGGKAIDLVRSGCAILCDAIGWRPHAELPPPDEQYLERGTAPRLTASLGPASAYASDGKLLGMRLRRDGGVTWFLQLDTAHGAALDLGAGVVAANRARQTVVSYALDARRRPLELVVHTVVSAEAGGGVRGRHGRAVAGLGAGAAAVSELDATLDLRDERNRAAANAFIAAVRGPLDAERLRDGAHALGERIARAGVLDRRTYAVS